MKLPSDNELFCQCGLGWKTKRIENKFRFINHFIKAVYHPEPAEALRSYNQNFVPGPAWRERLKTRNVSRLV